MRSQQVKRSTPPVEPELRFLDFKLFDSEVPRPVERRSLARLRLGRPLRFWSALHRKGSVCQSPRPRAGECIWGIKNGETLGQ